MRQTRSNARIYSKDAQQVLKVEASSRNSVIIKDDLTTSCAKYIWERHKGYDFVKNLSTFSEKTVFWEKNLICCNLEKQEENSSMKFPD